MLDQMQAELETAGYDAAIIAINSIDASTFQTQLTDRCAFPLFQDTEQVNAWALQDGAKDDIYIYDRDGFLVTYLPITGSVSTVLSTPGGYQNVWDALTAVP